MFEDARSTLFHTLSKWTFGTVIRQSVVPDGCVVKRDDGSQYVSHYFTTAEKLILLNNDRRKGRYVRPQVETIWVKKRSRMRKGLWLGPVQLAEKSDRLPRMGDIIVGELMEAEREVGVSKKGSDKQRVRTQKKVYQWWHGDARCLWELANITLNGTTKTEQELRSILVTSDEYDDVWALARLILFGNVQCFVNSTNLPPNERMRLNSNPVIFIQKAASAFHDPTILTRFQNCLPDVSLPPAVPQKPIYRSGQVEQNSLGEREEKSQHTYKETYNGGYGTADDSFIPISYAPTSPTVFAPVRQSRFLPKSSEYQESPPVFAPKSPTYNPRSPTYNPRSPTYNPRSPTYNPRSPTYNPTSPTYNPRSPTYNPRSPEFAPRSPTYNPRSPTYNPRSPEFAPRSPTYNPSLGFEPPSPSCIAQSSQSLYTSFSPNACAGTPFDTSTLPLPQQYSMVMSSVEQTLSILNNKK